MIRQIRYYYLRTLRQSGSVESIARGMAIGVFVGLIMPPLFQILVAVIIATFAKANRIVAAIGCWVSNPITFPIIYPFYYLIGSFLTGRKVQPIKMPGFEWGNLLADVKTVTMDIIAAGPDLMLVLDTGATLCALAGSIVSYYLTRALIRRYRERREEKQNTRLAEIRALYGKPDKPFVDESTDG